MKYNINLKRMRLQPAGPKLLKMLDLRGAVVTGDAMAFLPHRGTLRENISLVAGSFILNAVLERFFLNRGLMVFTWKSYFTMLRELFTQGIETVARDELAPLK